MKIGVIGAGASGMLFSIVAAKAGHEVTVFEKNDKCGKKLYLTGKGRCNLLNAADRETVLKNTVTNPKFLYGALSLFSPEDAYRFFEADLGLPLKTECGNRVFPASDKSSDVIAALTRGMKKEGVRLRLNSAVSALKTEAGKLVGLTSNGADEAFEAVVVATGGISYPATGSTGDGYRFADRTGHVVSEPRPALTAIDAEAVIGANEERFFLRDLPSLEGLSLKNVRLSVSREGKTLAEEFGEMLFTARGVSGPIALTLSSRINKFDFSGLRLTLDLKPALDREKLDRRVLREIEDNPNRIYKNLLATLLPSKLVPFFEIIGSVKGEKPSRSLTKRERLQLSELLKNVGFTGLSLGGFSSAVVTSGGVSVKDVDPRTMESKRVKGLYFIGEVLDVDALTGGFNLQIAFSTAFAAAKHLGGGK